MPRILGTILLSFILFSSAFAITTDTMSLMDNQQGQARLEMVESGDEGMRLSFDLPELQREEIEVENKVYQLLGFEGAAYVGEDGRPALPVITKLVAIPFGASVRVRLVDQDRETYGGYRILPMQPDEGDRFHIDSDYYSGAVHPARPAGSGPDASPSGI